MNWQGQQKTSDNVMLLQVSCQQNCYNSFPSTPNQTCYIGSLHSSQVCGRAGPWAHETFDCSEQPANYPFENNSLKYIGCLWHMYFDVCLHKDSKKFCNVTMFKIIVLVDNHFKSYREWMVVDQNGVYSQVLWHHSIVDVILETHIKLSWDYRCLIVATWTIRVTAMAIIMLGDKAKIGPFQKYMWPVLRTLPVRQAKIPVVFPGASTIFSTPFS